MRKYAKKAAICCMSAMLISSALIMIPDTPFMITAEAHCKRSESRHGHRGYRTRSESESYYYCGGHSAHYHNSGVCPYSNVSSSRATVAEEPVRETVPAVIQEQDISHCGWQTDATGWWYRETDGSCPKSAWKEIDSKCYYFDEDGYLMVNTTTPDGNQVDEDGVRVDNVRNNP